MLETPQPEEVEEVKAVVDVHEVREAERMVAAIFDHSDIDEVLTTALASADIVINGVGFERKTPGDFASSLTEERLQEQVLGLSDAFETAAIVVEGDYSDFDGLNYGPTAASLRGACASFHVRHGIPVLFCSTPELLVDRAVRYARKHTEDPSSSYLPTGDVGSDEPPTKQMYGCIDGVGEERASRLYERFPTVPELLAADVDEIQEVHGIGEVTAERILTTAWGANG